MATKNGLISVETQDAIGIPATTLYNITIDDSQTVANLVSEANELVAAQEPLSQGQITRYKVSIVVPFAGSAPVGDIEKGALFNFNNGSDSYATGVFVPDVNPAVLNSSGLIDLTNADVTSFIAFLTTAHTVITVVTKGVRALTGLKDALIAFRKHRKPVSRKTKEI